VNAATDNGQTALTIALQNGYLEVVRLLKASLPLPDK
jgi:ankyrin repeat protein